MFSILLAVYLGVELLAYIVTRSLTFQGTIKDLILDILEKGCGAISKSN